MIGVGDRVRLTAVANASDIPGPAIGSLGIVTAIHDMDDTGKPLALRVHFFDFDGRRLMPNAEIGTWIVGIDEVELTMAS